MQSRGYFLQGQASDVEIRANELLKTRLRLNELYAKHTGQSTDVIGAASTSMVFGVWKQELLLMFLKPIALCIVWLELSAACSATAHGVRP